MIQASSFTQPKAQSLAQKAAWALLATRLLYVGLLVFFCIWYLLVSPPHTANPWIIWLIHAIPLLCFLPGVIKASPRAFAWLCFVILVYFCEGSIYALSPDQATMGLLECLLTLLFFSSAIIFIRCNGKAHKAEAGIE